MGELNPSPDVSSRTSSSDAYVSKEHSGAVVPRAGAKTFEETDSLEDFYKPIAEYEGAHRYDPKFQWEPKEEKRVVRKIGMCFRSRKEYCADEDRCPDLHLGMFDVLRLAAGSRQYFPSVK